MSPYRRNVLVGVTVLIALGALAWMMLKFGATLVWPFAPAYMPIEVRADRGDGLGEGSAVFYKGVQVGRVVRVSRSEDDTEVIIDAEVDQSRPPPANVQGKIRIVSMLGGQSSLFLEPINGQPRGTLERGTVLRATYEKAALLPPEFSELAVEFRDAIREFRETRIIEHLDQEVQKVGKVVESVQQIVDDPKMREDLKAALANIRSTTEKADRIAGRLEKLSDDATETMTQARGTIGRAESELVSISRQIGERLVQVGKLVDQFQSISSKIDQNQGTAGKFVNDPRLYEAMVDTAREMRATVSDLRRLVQQWEQEGVQLKL